LKREAGKRQSNMEWQRGSMKGASLYSRSCNEWYGMIVKRSMDQVADQSDQNAKPQRV
jgi:hypothetical protein